MRCCRCSVNRRHASVDSMPTPLSHLPHHDCWHDAEVCNPGPRVHWRLIVMPATASALLPHLLYPLVDIRLQHSLLFPSALSREGHCGATPIPRPHLHPPMPTRMLASVAEGARVAVSPMHTVKRQPLDDQVRCRGPLHGSATDAQPGAMQVLEAFRSGSPSTHTTHRNVDVRESKCRASRW